MLGLIILRFYEVICIASTSYAEKELFGDKTCKLIDSEDDLYDMIPTCSNQAYRRRRAHYMFYNRSKNEVAEKESSSAEKQDNEDNLNIEEKEFDEDKKKESDLLKLISEICLPSLESSNRKSSLCNAVDTLESVETVNEPTQSSQINENKLKKKGSFRKFLSFFKRKGDKKKAEEEK